jgi:aminoglycoside 3-N-acetyltransferase
VEDFLASGQGVRGQVGAADSVFVDAQAMCAFAVAWMEKHCPAGP